MKYLSLALVVYFFPTLLHSQNKTTPCYTANFGDTLNKVFTRMEESPHYKGYRGKLNEYLLNEINIPRITSALPDSVRHIEDSVLVRFIISRDAQMSNLAVDSKNQLLAAEVKRMLIKASCNWVPGNSNRYVNGWCSGIIFFKLDRRNGLSINISSFFGDELEMRSSRN